MGEAARKDLHRKSIVSNARSIHGALDECLKISDQMNDAELKGETMLFVNAMEHLAASLQPHRRLRGSPRLSERELLNRLREEALHIRQLIEASGEIANETRDAGALEVLMLAVARLNRFREVIDRKAR
jgi:hypothetical protein